MTAHTERTRSPFTTPQLFAMVADIERYPEFIPWCRAARILERGEGELLAELVISFSHLSESYTSRVALKQPIDANHEGSIDVTMVKGPFEYLLNNWRFTPLNDGGAQIDFSLDFKFRSRILEKLMGSLFKQATLKMIGAFEQRAQALYGAGATA